mmetsp:Transcript_48725/g.97218  ORF Transcript_48725/g.97218 Transcript_48725/m.97218 type:complete len:83 (-) Transcript_48725:86-334(-)
MLPRASGLLCEPSHTMAVSGARTPWLSELPPWLSVVRGRTCSSHLQKARQVTFESLEANDDAVRKREYHEARHGVKAMLKRA